MDKSPSVSVLEALLAITNIRALSATNNVTGTQTTFVFRPGAVNPVAPIYNDFNTLYAAFTLSAGPRIVQIDNSIVDPVVIPAGSYPEITTIVGTFSSNTKIICNLSDGVSFPGLINVANNVILVSQSTSIPVLDVSTDQRVLILERGAGIRNDPASTVPFVNITGPNQILLISLTGGEIGSTGIHTAQAGPGSNIIIILDLFGSLSDDTLVGAGTAFILITSQSAFINTPSPQSQPAISFSSTVFDFANFISFQGLNPVNWVPPAPSNVEQAINRIADLLLVLNGGPIP